MSAKAPIYLKRRSRKGKKEKLRDLLSSDMISPPLGDFRHTIHIGSGGGADDLFGDLSFLQGKFHLLPGQQGHALSQYGGGELQFSRTASISGRLPSSESSPLLKNALSLPVIGGVQALTLPTAITTSSTPNPTSTSSPTSTTPTPTSSLSHTLPKLQAPPPKPPRLHLEDHRTLGGHVSSSPTRLPSPPSCSQPHGPPGSEADGFLLEGEEEEEGRKERPYLSHAGSLLSLHLDLGPSILEEVLQIMDSQQIGSFGGGFASPGGRQEIYT